MKRWRQWLLILLFTDLVPSTLMSTPSTLKSACVQQRNHGLISAAYRTYRSDHFWNSDGKRRAAYNIFKFYAYRLYAEYGMTNRNTLTARAGWAHVDESLNGTTFGFEDVELGWRHCLGKKWGHLFSAEFVGIVPTKNKYEPGLRYGKWGGEVNLLISKGFSLGSWYGSYDMRLGYRVYKGFPSDQALADAGINFFPFPQLRVTASGHLVYGVWNGKSRIDESFFLLNPNFRLLRGQIEATYCVYQCVSIFAGYYRHLWGRNVGTNGGLYTGAQIDF